MKATGIVRKIDELGRVVIPKELRRTRGLAEGTPMEIYVEGDKIIFEKYGCSCDFCGNPDAPFDFCGRHICKKCAKKIAKMEAGK